VVGAAGAAEGLKMQTMESTRQRNGATPPPATITSELRARVRGSLKPVAHRAPAGLLALSMVVSALVGCKARSPSHYDSPRVLGQVRDAKTHQPIAGVKIQRVVPDYGAGTLNQTRGGEILQRPQPIRSQADGSFNLDSQKSLSLFSEFAWFSVEISFEHHNYDRLVTYYTPTNAITAPSGEPVIHAGEILLQPKTSFTP
jgi:hypothetical protein